MKKNHNIIELSVIIKHETDKAIMVENLKGKDIWLPKSQVEVDSPTEIQIPEWLAVDKELI